MQPEILLLDEPTNGLDDNARARVIEVLQGIPQSLLVVSHDLSLIQQVTRTQTVLEKGRLGAARMRPAGSGAADRPSIPSSPTDS